MSGQFTNNAAAAGIRRPSTFLSLAPVQSETYSNLAEQSSASPTASKIAPPSPEIKAVPADTRSERSNSVASESGKQRFLKLGPVFYATTDDGYALED